MTKNSCPKCKRSKKVLKILVSKPLEEKKQERTKAKQQVTTASRTLTRAVHRGVDIDILTVLIDG